MAKAGLLSSYEDGAWLREVRARAQARTLRNKPLTVEERLTAFREIGFTPWGLYLPEKPELAIYQRNRLRELGQIEETDQRLQQYHRFQSETERWELDGEPGTWSGQQALARCTTRFRIAGQGRRSGKTTYAAHEAVALALFRPRSTIWVAGPRMSHVERCFDIIWEIVHDLHVKLLVQRNSAQEKLIVLENGSRFEGVTLIDYLGAAGASVNLCIVDEAAQVSREAWIRAVLPPLTDTNGGALILSSYEGQGGFFYDQVEEAKASGSGDWAAFHGNSWDNFFMFPQGIDSPGIQQIKRNTPPLDFLEQYGAIPAGTRNRVYPEFRRSVHAGDYPFNPEWEVRLAIDPSKGANEYAVLAIQKDPKSKRLYAIDEIYLAGAIAEEVHRLIRRKPWFDHLGECAMDNADPNEILRWVEAGFRAFAVPDKPHVEDRYPIVKRLLRDPVLYWPIYEAKLLSVLAAKELSLEQFKTLPIEDQRPIYIDVEEAFTDLRLTPEDLAALRGTSHFFVNELTCPNLIEEFENYAFVKNRVDQLNRPERGRKYKDHLLDAWGYFCWVWEREDYLISLEPTDQDIYKLGIDISLPEIAVIAPPPPRPEPRAEGPAERASRVTALIRAQFSPNRDWSFVEERWD